MEGRLSTWLAGEVARAEACGAETAAVVRALCDLTGRGGKRVRAVLLAVAYEGVGGEGGAERSVMAQVSMELLQTYLLIHDDWMDGDATRRGGPSVHMVLQKHFADEHAGSSGAILAGDHAAALSQKAFFESDVAPAHLVRAARAFASMQVSVVLGQTMDVFAPVLASNAALGRERVEAIHTLKTGSYTVGGPLAVGALLGGASDAAVGALLRFAEPVGVAFQLRDDLLGTFGDPERTGKPKGNDLRNGKRTALLAELYADAPALAARIAEAGLRGAVTPEDAAEAIHVLEASGGKSRVEARSAELLSLGERLLSDVPLTADAKMLLRGAVRALGEREN